MKHWIFDLDGTLVDSFPAYRQVLESVLEDYGTKLSDDDITFMRHLPLPKMLERCLEPNQVVEAAKKVIETSIGLSRRGESGVRVFSGFIELLDFLRAQGCRLSVCTARERSTAAATLQETGLIEYFDHWISRDCVAVTKPHPEGILKILEHAGSVGHEAVMIGDHKMDIDAARAAGVYAVSVRWDNDNFISSTGSDVQDHSDRHFTAVQDLYAWAQEVLR